MDERSVGPDMAAAAAHLVAFARSSGSDLDFDGTPPSAYDLDALVENAGADPTFAEQMAVPAGAYLGELVVRSGGGSWTVDETGQPCVRTRTGWYWWPLVSVTRRGHEPGAPALFDVYAYAMAGADVPAPETVGVVPRFGTDLARSQWSWAAHYAAQMALVGQPVTWDAASVAVLDTECDRLAATGLTPEQVEDVAGSMGAYLGELLRADIGGTWVFAGDDVGLKVSDALTCFPLAKVAKRLTEGPEQGLVGFYETTRMIGRGELRIGEV